jgi:oxygen-independent coproporphyrinogen-3 oxidase
VGAVVETLPLAELLTGPAGPAYGLYVHCLFCRRRCPYCDFNVAIYREDRIRPFVAGLADELARYAALPWAGRVSAVSLFFGGGTPSLLPPESIAELIGAARERLGLVPDAEVTLEANPEGLDAARLAGFRAAGVTRLSLGVQSLDDRLLAALTRRHGTRGSTRSASICSTAVRVRTSRPGSPRWTRSWPGVPSTSPATR